MAQETIFDINGQKITAKVWHPEQPLRILALHGWLDNAASFDKLAPLLPAHIVALDLPGHGLSDHISLNDTFHLIDLVTASIQVADALGWDQFILLGHSLGAAISTLIAGTLTQRIQGVILIDGLGPITTAPEDAPAQYKLFLTPLSALPNKVTRRYDSQAQALHARLKASPMEQASAWALIERGTKQLSSGQWTWRTDPKLLMPSAIHFTEPQVLAFLRAIRCAVLIIRPQPGFPYSPNVIEARLNALSDVEVIRCEGNHHVHLDDPKTVANIIRPFLEKLSPVADA